MLSESDLRELLDFKASRPVVSIYLNTEPSEGNADAYRLRLRNMLKEVELTEDVSAIERYFNLEYNWAGRSVAVFSCAAEGFFRAYPLNVPVRSMLHVDNHLAVKPLADLLDNYGGYGVVLIDKQGARLFSFHMGELQEQDGMLGETVKHTKQGGASSMPGRRGGTAGQTHYVDEVIDRNMKEMGDFAVHFFEQKHVRRILIGGTDDNIAAFRAVLPKSWQSLIMGTFAMSMTANHLEVLTRALELGQEAEKQHEARMVENMLAAAAKSSGGVAGLSETLDAVNQHKVQTLLVMEGLQQKGFRCVDCGSLALIGTNGCAACGGRLESAADVVDMAVHSVLRGGGEVQVVHDNQALERAGRIGALLRY